MKAVQPDSTMAREAREERLWALAPLLKVELSVSQHSSLIRYLDLIKRWNQVYNLTSIRNDEEMFVRHLLDCLAVVQPLRQGLQTYCASLQVSPPLCPLQILDVGSGAGLPGIVLALLNPEWHITCIDAVGKKASFIRQAALELGLSNVNVVHGRVEADRALDRCKFDLVVSRAFASLRDFVELTRNRLALQGIWAALKANLSEEERKEVPVEVNVFHVEPVEVPDLHEARCLVWMHRQATSAIKTDN